LLPSQVLQRKNGIKMVQNFNKNNDVKLSQKMPKNAFVFGIKMFISMTVK
jgi:hypothetical protein